MDRDKLMKMASAVRTGGKGTVRRCGPGDLLAGASYGGGAG
jgi:hypothetical protein